MNSKKRKIDKVDSSQHVTRKPAQGRTGSVVDLTTTSETEDDDSNDVEFVGISSDKPAMSKATTTISNSINSVLRDSASTAPKSSNALPPLHLHTQSQLDKHGLPCSLIPDILPVELAERLYRAMLRESTTWERNTWWLADRQVTSPHTTCFYSRNDDGDKQHDEAHWYMGRKATYGRSNAVEGAATEDSEGPRPFLSEMREAAAIIQRRVNDVLSSYTRYGMEYDGPWRANVAAANCYRGAAETVGAHADQLTYLGPFPTIASLSLGTPRNFRLRAVPSVQDDPNVPSTIRTYDIHLPHNSLCIMHAGCQERYKHSIPPQRSLDLFKLKNRETGQAETFNERINVRGRVIRLAFYRSIVLLIWFMADYIQILSTRLCARNHSCLRVWHTYHTPSRCKGKSERSDTARGKSVE